MYIHTCLSLHECSLGGIRCPCFTLPAAEWYTKNRLLHVYAFSSMWHPCWIVCLQHRKKREWWNTGSSALNWKCAWKDHPTAQIIFATGEKRVKKQAKTSLVLSNIPQNYNKDSSSPLTQLLQFWFFPGSSSPNAISSLKSAWDRWPSFFLAGHQNRQHLPSLFWSQHRWWPPPFHCSFFFFFPSLT